VAVSGRAVAFRYRRGAGVLYRLPAGAKLAGLLVFTVLVMYVPLAWIGAGLPLLWASALALSFTPGEIWADCRPALYYAASLYGINLTARLFEGGPFEWRSFFAPDPYYLLLSVRLLAAMQMGALFFRSTTAVEIKDALCAAEETLRRGIRKLPCCRRLGEEARLSFALALALNFIPELFELWASLERAALARGCRGRLARTRLLLPQLFSLALRRASQKALVLAARRG